MRRLRPHSADEGDLMAGKGLPRFTRAALYGALLLGCAEGAPDTGAQIEVVNGAGVTTPSHLRFDWSDGERVLVRDRRVPDKGSLEPGPSPLAVVRIASDVMGEAQRTITVRGLLDDLTIVSQGTALARISKGSWQKTTVVLSTAPGSQPDAGAHPDARELETGGAPPDAGPDAYPPDAESPDAPADSQPDSSDAGDVPTDAQPPAADMTPDLPPPGPVTIAPIADSYAEQGASTAGMNYGKATILEVKTQNGADNTRIAYLRFPLAAANGTVATATLRLYGKSGAGVTMESAFAVMDDTWTETGINWNNKPALGAKQSTVTVGTTAQYREWNVTNFVKAQQAAGQANVSLAVSMDIETSNAPDVHNSREAASNPPQLVVTK
jgi:hypothetical protein